MQTASVGRIVLMRVDPSTNNGSDIAPAIVTRVWGDPYTPEHDELGERQTINVKVLLDQKDTLWLTSVLLFAEQPDVMEVWPHRQDGIRAHAFWPPRV